MLSICGCLLSSCSLDLQPENGLTYSNSFNTEKELNATTTSIQYYINTVVGNNYVLSTAGMKADEILDGKQLQVSIHGRVFMTLSLNQIYCLII